MDGGARRQRDDERAPSPAATPQPPHARPTPLVAASPRLALMRQTGSKLQQRPPTPRLLLTLPTGCSPIAVEGRSATSDARWRKCAAKADSCAQVECRRWGSRVPPDHPDASRRSCVGDSRDAAAFGTPGVGLAATAPRRHVRWPCEDSPDRKWKPRDPRHADYWKQQIENALLAPVRAMRLEYLPLLMVYFAYGAMGLTAVAEAFWIKKGLTWTPAELSALAVWFSLPWTVKMVFGELVDTVPLFGSQRRAYVFVGAGLIAVSFVLLAGAAGGWIRVLPRRPALRGGLAHGRDGLRDPGRRRRRHEHRGGAARQSRRQPARRRPRSTTTSAWCRCWAGWRSRSASSPWQGSRAGWHHGSPTPPCFCAA